MQKHFIAIDPGNIESAYVFWDGKALGRFGKVPNDDLIDILRNDEYLFAVVEQVASYGMAVGETTFDTVWWSGRFAQTTLLKGLDSFRIKRVPVKMHLCYNPTAKDGNVIQALVDRFAGADTRNKGKGTKKDPGFFYGFAGDIWQAFAVAVTWLDKNPGYRP